MAPRSGVPEEEEVGFEGARNLSDFEAHNFEKRKRDYQPSLCGYFGLLKMCAQPEFYPLIRFLVDVFLLPVFLLSKFGV